jgi:hypothetical protein
MNGYRVSKIHCKARGNLNRTLYFPLLLSSPLARQISTGSQGDEILCNGIGRFRLRGLSHGTMVGYQGRSLTMSLPQRNME